MRSSADIRASRPDEISRMQESLLKIQQTLAHAGDPEDPLSEIGALALRVKNMEIKMMQLEWFLEQFFSQP